jgi:c-di-GMP-binding flagellar brake protein YcgR
VPTKRPINSDLLERRRHRRFAIYELIAVDEKGHAQLLDISMGGLAVGYIDDHFSNKSFELNLTHAGVENPPMCLRCRTVSDCEFVNGSFSVMRRLGLQFTDLTETDKLNLVNFISTANSSEEERAHRLYAYG